MEDARIHDGDVLVVDRALEPEHGSIVIAAADNEVSDIPDWAKSPEILNADRQIKKDVNSEHDGVKVTNGFLLTNNGWIHQKLFGK